MRLPPYQWFPAACRLSWIEDVSKNGVAGLGTKPPWPEVSWGPGTVWVVSSHSSHSIWPFFRPVLAQDSCLTTGKNHFKTCPAWIILSLLGLLVPWSDRVCLRSWILDDTSLHHCFSGTYYLQIPMVDVWRHPDLLMILPRLTPHATIIYILTHPQTAATLEAQYAGKTYIHPGINR